MDTTLFIRKKNCDILLVQIYVDDILFGSTNKELCEEFSKMMRDEFEMSMMGELGFFLGLNIKQGIDGIFINQTKYTFDDLRSLHAVDRTHCKGVFLFFGIIYFYLMTCLVFLMNVS